MPQACQRMLQISQKYKKSHGCSGQMKRRDYKIINSRHVAVTSYGINKTIQQQKLM